MSTRVILTHSPLGCLTFFGCSLRTNVNIPYLSFSFTPNSNKKHLCFSLGIQTVYLHVHTPSLSFFYLSLSNDGLQQLGCFLLIFPEFEGAWNHNLYKEVTLLPIKHAIFDGFVVHLWKPPKGTSRFVMCCQTAALIDCISVCDFCFIIWTAINESGSL